MKDHKPEDTVITAVSSVTAFAVANDKELIGEILGQRYRILETIGSGSMGTVYKADHLLLHKLQAVKVMHRHLTEESLRLQRFQIEAQAASLLRHENLLTVTDYGLTASRQPYIVMDFVEGQSLAVYLKEHGRLSASECMAIFDQVIEGLIHAHEKGVIHRDLKPTNIIISAAPQRTARIVDFGVAKILSPAAGPAQQLTQTGEIFGTPYYMSPEQCRGGAIDARCDIYSLGCVMFEALTGSVPVNESTAVETLFKHMTGTIPSISEIYPELKIPETLESVVSKCVANDPDKRYQSAKELKEGLLRVDANGKSAPLRRKQKQTSLVPKNKRLVLGLITPLLLGAAVYIYLMVQQVDQQKLHNRLSDLSTAQLKSADALVAAAWKKYASAGGSPSFGGALRPPRFEPRAADAALPLAAKALAIRQNFNQQSPQIQAALAESLNQVAFFMSASAHRPDTSEINSAKANEVERMYRKAIALAADEKLNLLDRGKSLYRRNLADFLLDLEKPVSAELLLEQVLKTMDAKNIHSLADLNANDVEQNNLLRQFEDVYWSLHRDLDAAKIAVVLGADSDAKYNALKVEKNPSFAGHWRDDLLDFTLPLKINQQGSIDGTIHDPSDDSDDAGTNANTDTAATDNAKADITKTDDTTSADNPDRDASGQAQGPIGFLEWDTTGGPPFNYNKATIIRIGKYLVWHVTTNGNGTHPAEAVLTRTSEHSKSIHK